MGLNIPVLLNIGESGIAHRILAKRILINGFDE